MIKTNKLNLSLGQNPILKNVSVELPKGKLTALIGPNGAGKSTLLHVISRLLRQDRGEVSLNERPINDYAHDELARHLAVLRQESHFGSRLSVEDLVAFGRYPHNKGRRTTLDDDIVKQSLADFELQGISSQYLDTLSGGQRQRAFLAMIFAQSTDTVLLDEPLNNLDLSHARRLMHLINSQVQRGRSFVLVLHDLNYAARYADYIVALKNGAVFTSGETKDVLTATVLSELYDTEIQIVQLNGAAVVLSF